MTLPGPPPRPARDFPDAFLAYRPAAAVAASHWRRPERFDFLRGWTAVALGEAELMQTAHHLPIGVRRWEGAPPVVVGILAANAQRQPLVGDDGRWLRGYSPVLLRCLPFRLPWQEDGEEELVLAEDLDLLGGKDLPTGAPLRRPDGRPTPDIARVGDLLRRTAAGARELSQAADRLLMLDLLLPLGSTDPGETATALAGTHLLTVDPERFAALAGLRLSAAVRDDYLALSLAVACLFSQRHLAANVGPVTEVSGVRRTAKTSQADLDVQIRGLNEIHLTLDPGDLFRIEDLETPA